MGITGPESCVAILSSSAYRNKERINNKRLYTSVTGLQKKERKKQFGEEWLVMVGLQLLGYLEEANC